MQNSELATLAVEGQAAVIAIDDGKVNAMSVRMLTRITTLLDEALKTAAPVVVLRGRAGIFSAGFDLPTIREGAAAAREMVCAGVALLIRLLESPKPVLACVEGHAYPMGAFLVLACDSRIARQGDWLIGLNEPAIGITVPAFARALIRHRLTPAAVARSTIALMSPAAQAREDGYVDLYAPAEEFASSVKAETERLAALDSGSFRASKAQLNSKVIADLTQELSSLRGTAQ